nr:MAG TPA: Cro/C1-type HTH DNA-binding domain protein [Caudoviricetes sp.]
MESEFLEALDAYMKKHSLKKSDLSRMTGLPYTTIDGWYKKGPDGIRMSTIRKLSNSLNVPMSYWVEKPSIDGDESVSEEPSQMTRLMWVASENKKKLIRLILEMPDELLDGMTDYLRSARK